MLHSIVRLVSCAAFAVVCASQSLPASAEFHYMTPAQERVYRCQQARKHGDYQTSLQLCLASAAEFKRMGDAQKINPWYLYEVQGMMLEAAAYDYSALGRHADAQSTAAQAHDLLLYVYKTYKMDPDDRKELSGIADRVARFIAVEHARRQALQRPHRRHASTAVRSS